GRVTDTSVSEALRKSLDNARSLECLAQRLKIPIFEPFAGLCDSTRSIWVAGPSQDYYESLLPGFRCTPESAQPVGIIQKAFRAAEEAIKTIVERWDFETLDDTGETTAENNSSVILLLAVGDTGLLLTSDAGIPALTLAVNWLESHNVDL